MQTLKLGVKNKSAVKTLQSLLNASTQIDVTLNVDGVFGTNTKKAVIAYQTANKLESDGVVGPITWAKLQGQEIPVSAKPVDYKQYDSGWGKKLYTSTGNKKQTMASSACGPTAMADVVATFFDTNVTPYTLAQLAVKKGYRTVNSGTSWNFFKFMATQYEFSAFKQTSNHDTFLDALSKGALVVCSMGPDYWTKSGHFICAWKYENGYVYANDPASGTRTKQKLSAFKGDRKQYFIFYPPIGWGDTPEDDDDDVVVPETPVEEIPTDPVVVEPVVNFTPLSNGSTDDDVSALQFNLMSLGFNLTKDGKFGSNTAAKLKLFQKAFGLAQTGVYDIDTHTALTALIASRPTYKPYTGAKGIYDISRWQGSINWKKVKASDKVGLVVIRAGYGQKTIDTRFVENVQGCIKYGIPFMVYWFSYATSIVGAENEATNFYNIASPYKPLAYVMDAEDSRVDGSFINAFADKIKEVSNDAKTGLYVANHLFAHYEKEGMDTNRWDWIWIPRGNNIQPTHRPLDWWQYSFGSKVDGIGGNVDQNKIPDVGRYSLDWYLGLV